MHIKEVLNQGDPLENKSYVIGILPLIHELHAHPHVTQPWYEDNLGTGGEFAVLQEHMRDLMVRGPPQGYFPDPTKSFLVVSPQNVPMVEAYFRGVRVVTRSLYLGGFISDPDAEKS